LSVEYYENSTLKNHNFHIFLRFCADNPSEYPLAQCNSAGSNEITTALSMQTIKC